MELSRILTAVEKDLSLWVLLKSLWRILTSSEWTTKDLHTIYYAKLLKEFKLNKELIT